MKEFVYFLHIFTKSVSMELVTVVIVINVLIGGFNGEDSRWLETVSTSEFQDVDFLGSL